MYSDTECYNGCVLLVRKVKRARENMLFDVENEKEGLFSPKFYLLTFLL